VSRQAFTTAADLQRAALFSLTHLQSVFNVLFFFSILNFNGLSLHTWHLLHVSGHDILFALTPHCFSLFEPTHEQSLYLEIKPPSGFSNRKFNVESTHVTTGAPDGEFPDGEILDVSTGAPDGEFPDGEILDGALVASGPRLKY
jgi:hypothetical protein